MSRRPSNGPPRRASSPLTLNIRRIDCASDDARAAIAELRRELSPRGNVVSPEGRARTIAAFGEPLTPPQVVERICADVAARGLAAVLDYTRRLDGVALEPGTVRVSRASWRPPIEAADPAYLQTLETSARTSWRTSGHPQPRRQDRARAGNRAGPALSAPAAGRRLHSRRGGGVSVDAADDGRPGAGGGRRGDRRGRPAHAVRRLQHRPAGRLPRPGRDRGLPDRRRPGRRGPGLRRRGRSGRSTRSSARATCSSRWPSGTSTARSISTASPGPARSC